MQSRERGKKEEVITYEINYKSFFMNFFPLLSLIVCSSFSECLPINITFSAFLCRKFHIYIEYRLWNTLISQTQTHTHTFEHSEYTGEKHIRLFVEVKQWFSFWCKQSFILLRMSVYLCVCDARALIRTVIFLRCLFFSSPSHHHFGQVLYSWIYMYFTLLW